MSDDNFKKENLKYKLFSIFSYVKLITTLDNDLEEEKLNNQDLKEEEQKEEEQKEEKQKEEKQKEEKQKDRKFNFLSTLLATLLGVFVAFLGADFISEKQKNETIKQAESQKTKAESQEVESVIQLLKIAEDDAYLKLSAIEYTETLVNQHNLKQKNEGGDLTSILQVYSTPSVYPPYPMVFEKVINNDRVLSHLTITGLASLFSIQKALERQRADIMSLSINDSDRLFILKEYKVNLVRVSTMLENEIQSIKGNLSEREVFELYKKKEKQIYGLTEEKQECLLNF